MDWAAFDAIIDRFEQARAHMEQARRLYDQAFEAARAGDFEKAAHYWADAEAALNRAQYVERQTREEFNRMNSSDPADADQTVAFQDTADDYTGARQGADISRAAAENEIRDSESWEQEAFKRELTRHDRKRRDERRRPVRWPRNLPVRFRRWLPGLGLGLAIGLGTAAFFIFFPPGSGLVPVVQALPNALPGVGALSWGDTHLVTFDRLQVDFQAVGEFVLVRSDAGDLEVQVRQQPALESETASMNTAVAANVAGDRVSLDTEQEPSVHVNGDPTTVPADGITLPNGGQISFDGRSAYTLTWPDGSVVELQAFGLNDRWIDARVHLAESRSGSVTGLLGNADGDEENDLMRTDGTVVSVEGLSYEDLYDDFGDSWRIRPADSLFDYDSGESTETFTDLEFPDEVVTIESLSDHERRDATRLCRDAGVTEEPFLTTCVLDVALTDDPDFAEATAALQEAASGAPNAFGGERRTRDVQWREERNG